MSEQLGKPIEVHVLASFHCETCGQGMNQLTCAPLLADGRVDMHADIKAFGELVCNDCRRARTDQEMEKYRKKKAQRDWVKKHSPEVNR